MDLGLITSELKRRAGIHADPSRASTVSGGSINQAFKLPSDRGAIFLKVNGAEMLPAFEAEAEGLDELRSADGVAVPVAIDVGCVGDTSYLALEWIDLRDKTVAAQMRLGRGLARQHRVSADLFGWHRDNTIGATAQPNKRCSDWLDFLTRERLGFQLDLAAERGLPKEHRSQGDSLLRQLARFLEGYAPEASLLHGDLWSGNWGADASDAPFIYDPAVYYGDREADLAMSRLFGGFGKAFYAAYEDEWPLAAGWEARVDLYNLYHLLNHFNLFGAGYLGQVGNCLSRLLRPSS